MLDIKYEEITAAICPNRYLNSFGYTAAKILSRLENEILKAGGIIIGGNYINANWDTVDMESTRIQRVPKSYITYLINGYHCYVQLSDVDFWMFDGADLSVNKIEGDIFYSKKYGIKVPISLHSDNGHGWIFLEESVSPLIHQCLHPDEVYTAEEPIPTQGAKNRSNLKYVSVPRKLDPKFYFF